MTAGDVEADLVAAGSVDVTTTRHDTGRRITIGSRPRQAAQPSTRAGDVRPGA